MAKNIKATCECGKEFQIKYASYVANLKKNGKYICIGCKVKQSFTPERKEQLSKQVTDNWNGSLRDKIGKSWTKEKKKEASEKSKLLWDDNLYKQKTKMSNKTKKEISRRMKEKWKDPCYRDKVIKHITENYDKICGLLKKNSIVNKEIIASKLREKWKDPVFREKMMLIKDGTYRKNISNKSKQWWKENHEMMSQLISENTTKLWERPEYRKKMSEMSRKLWENEDYRNKLALAHIRQPKTSSQQKILYSILDDLQIQYHKDDSEQCKIGYYCFDCRIDPQNNLNRSLLIEVQGTYWHSRPKTISLDRSKATYLKTYFPEFDLRYIWEHEFDNKDRVINLIKYWTNLDEQDQFVFSLSQLEEKQIDYKEAEIFISKYHYAGRVGRSGINLGYYVGNELAAVIVYSHPIRKETATKQKVKFSEILELSRLAINPHYQIKNMASCIIAKSIKFIANNNQNIKLLISFADTTFNHYGTIYKASNWKLDGDVRPDYWYVDDGGYVCHKKTLWNKAKKNNMTESEYSKKFKYDKVWGGKKLRYIYNING